MPCDGFTLWPVYPGEMTNSTAPLPLVETPADVDQAHLVRRARRGEREAFEQLYREHAHAVHALAWRITSDREAAEDVVQETFLRMLRWMGGLRPGEPVLPWLKQVASRLAIDRLRRVWRDVPGALEDIDAAQGVEPAEYSEAAGLLERLPPLTRALIWLNQIEGWSHQELGRRFGRSESWSKSMVSRALAQLRQHIHAEGGRHDVP